jgi:2-enoate reductase
MHTDALVRDLTAEFTDWVKKEPEGKEFGKCSNAAMTQELYPYDSMFSPIRVNRLTLKNRLVMAPMGNIDMCEETGRPNDQMLEYFFARARGGVGLITTGLVPISHGIDNSVTEPGELSYFPRFDRSRTVIVGWRDLAQGIHTYGSRLFIQLTAGLGRVGNPQCLVNEHKFPVSASFNPNFYIPQIPCLRLSDRKLGKIIKNMGQATADAKATGIDGVYLHGHEGYLLEQMTNPAFNRRKLGRFANWQTFGLEMVKTMRQRGGKDYPIMYRIDLSLALNETYGEEGMREKALKKFTKGRSVEQTLEYMENLVKAGVDMFDVDLGCYDNWWLPHPPSSMPSGCFLDVAKTVKDHFKKKGILSNAGLEVPVVAVGKLGYPDLSEHSLREGYCDMVMLGRPLLADPDWPMKAYSGKVSSIRPCIGCQEGCLNEFVEGGHPQCAVNPRTSFEFKLPLVPAKVEQAKKIAVVGSGPAGVVFAITAAKRGHSVELFEKQSCIGGRIVAGSVPRIKFDIANYLKYLDLQLKETSLNYDLTCHFDTLATLEDLKKGNYDSVVFSVGTKNVTPKFPGFDMLKSVQAVDLLLDEKPLEKATSIVIIGGGVVGCEVAHWLSYEKQKKVTVVEMMPNFMEGSCTANRGHLLHSLKQAKVGLRNCTKVTAFTKDGVEVERIISKGVPDAFNTWQPILPKNIENPFAAKIGKATEKEFLAADLVVLAMGGRPDNELLSEAQKQHVAAQVHSIGDGFQAGKVLEAVRAGYRLAIGI